MALLPGLAVNYTDRADLAVAAPSIRQALGVNDTTMGPLFTSLTAAADPAATSFGSRMVWRWFLSHGRGLASSIFDSGSQAGWRASFVITGLLGFVWAPAWFVIYRKPEVHPDVTPGALREMAESRAATAADEPPMHWISLSARSSRCRSSGHRTPDLNPFARLGQIVAIADPYRSSLVRLQGPASRTSASARHGQCRRS